MGCGVFFAACVLAGSFRQTDGWETTISKKEDIVCSGGAGWTDIGAKNDRKGFPDGNLRSGSAAPSPLCCPGCPLCELIRVGLTCRWPTPKCGCMSADQALARAHHTG
jgi:hypothetical protein